MSIHQIKVQPLTQKAFSQYGTCIDLPAEGDYELRPLRFLSKIMHLHL